MRALFLAAAFAVLAVQPAQAEENRISRLEEAFFLGRSAASAELSRVPFWQDLLAREQNNAAGGSALQDLLRTAGVAAQDKPQAALALVNEAINAAAYVSDRANFSAADVWQTSVELAARGGDCEDFAAAKYFALRKLGYSIDSLEIALVFDERTKNRHAVLMVRLDDQVVVLDNISNAILPASALDHYRPLLALNEAGWKMAAPTLRSAKTGEAGPLRTLAAAPDSIVQEENHQRPSFVKAGFGAKRANVHARGVRTPHMPSRSGLFVCAEHAHSAGGGYDVQDVPLEFRPRTLSGISRLRFSKE